MLRVDGRIAIMLAVIALPFGILGAVMAYLNAYEGWSHFPAISRKKRVALALEAAGFALLIMLIVFVIVLLLFRE